MGRAARPAGAPEAALGARAGGRLAAPPRPRERERIRGARGQGSGVAAARGKRAPRRAPSRPVPSRGSERPRRPGRAFPGSPRGRRRRPGLAWPGLPGARLGAPPASGRRPRASGVRGAVAQARAAPGRPIDRSVDRSIAAPKAGRGPGVRGPPRPFSSAPEGSGIWVRAEICFPRQALRPQERPACGREVSGLLSLLPRRRRRLHFLRAQSVSAPAADRPAGRVLPAPERDRGSCCRPARPLSFWFRFRTAPVHTLRFLLATTGRGAVCDAGIRTINPWSWIGCLQGEPTTPCRPPRRAVSPAPNCCFSGPLQ